MAMSGSTLLTVTITVKLNWAKATTFMRFRTGKAVAVRESTRAGVQSQVSAHVVGYVPILLILLKMGSGFNTTL